MSVFGCNNINKFVLGAGAEAKSMTNNLPLLSVLWLVIVLFFGYDFVIGITVTITVDCFGLSNHPKFVKVTRPGRWIGNVSVNKIV
jgi:hypothetical protein